MAKAKRRQKAPTPDSNIAEPPFTKEDLKKASQRIDKPELSPEQSKT